jgi:2-polyprenyl-3-methyl-5-hydroxy-6-metoxy-1,4-benzoquinol methylase
LFDPLFFPDPEPLGDLYDFITCTETIEHFHRPAEEFARLDRMLRPGGVMQGGIAALKAACI